MLKARLGLLLVHGSTELEEKSEQFLFLYSNFPFSLDNPSRKKMTATILNMISTKCRIVTF